MHDENNKPKLYQARSGQNNPNTASKHHQNHKITTETTKPTTKQESAWLVVCLYLCERNKKCVDVNEEEGWGCEEKVRGLECFSSVVFVCVFVAKRAEVDVNAWEIL